MNPDSQGYFLEQNVYPNQNENAWRLWIWFIQINSSSFSMDNSNQTRNPRKSKYTDTDNKIIQQVRQKDYKKSN